MAATAYDNAVNWRFAIILKLKTQWRFKTGKIAYGSLRVYLQTRFWQEK